MERHLRMFAKLGLRSTDLLLKTEMHAILPKNIVEILQKYFVKMPKNGEERLPTMPKIDISVTAMPSIQKLKALHFLDIKASEMLVAPRILECFGLPWSTLVCYSLPWSAIVCLGVL